MNTIFTNQFIKCLYLIHYADTQLQGGFSKDVCRSMIAMMDVDRSGKLGFEEFKKLWVDIRSWQVRKNITCKILYSLINRYIVFFGTFQKINGCLKFFQRVFKLYDKESTGFLSPFELREALASAGYHLNTHILNVLGHRYASKDGKIAFDDFMMCAVRLKSMMGKFEAFYTFFSLNRASHSTTRV